MLLDNHVFWNLLFDINDFPKNQKKNTRQSVTTRPSVQNDCWQRTFQQTMDMLQLFNYSRFNFDFFCCDRAVLMFWLDTKKHLV